MPNSVWLGLEPAPHICAPRLLWSTKGSSLTIKRVIEHNEREKQLQILCKASGGNLRPPVFVVFSAPVYLAGLRPSSSCLETGSTPASWSMLIQAQASLTATHAFLQNPLPFHLYHILLPQLSFKNTNLIDFSFLFFCSKFSWMPPALKIKA